MSTEELKAETSLSVLERSSGTEEDVATIISATKDTTLEITPINFNEISTLKSSELTPINDQEVGDINDVSNLLTHSKPETIKKEHVPGNLSPLSKKLRRDSLRTQLKRACTLALTEQPKINPNLKRRCRRHSTGTSKDITKKTVVKKNMRKSLASNSLKRKREDSTNEHRSEELKYVEDLRNSKESKFRRKSNESSLSEPIKSEIFAKTEKELGSPIKSSEGNKCDSNKSNSPARTRRSTRLSPETFPKKVSSAKKRGRPVKTANSDGSQQDNPSKTEDTPSENIINEFKGKLFNNSFKENLL